MALLTFIPAAGGGASSGWTKVGTDVELSVPTDNVGIGTAPGPGLKLDVLGDVRVTGKLTLTGALDPTMCLLSGADKRFGATDAGTIYLAPFANSTTGVQVRKADDVTVVLDVDTTNSRLGVGTAAPVTTLDVVGVAKANVIRLPEQVADPAFVANTGFVYTKDVAGVTQLFFEDDAGTVSQLTPASDADSLQGSYTAGGGAILLTLAGGPLALTNPAATAQSGLTVVQNTAGQLAADFTGDVRVTGKLTVTGLIDPTGVYLDAGADQAAVAGKAVIYSKTVLGVTQVFARADDGTITQITPTATPATPTLAQVLVAGNVTGARDVLVTTGQQLDAATLGTVLNLATTNAASVGIGSAAGVAGTLQVFINQGGATLHGSGSGVQYSSTTASRAQYRANQYGNNTGVPGISTFKSRGATVGALAGVVDGDVLYRATCVGVAGDNVSIPLAGFISIDVPVGGSNPGQAWVATDFDIQLVPLAGPINSRREVYRLTSEAAMILIDGTTAPVGPATKGAIRYKNSVLGFQFSANGGPWTTFGTVTDLQSAYNGGNSIVETLAGGAVALSNPAASAHAVLTLTQGTAGQNALTADAPVQTTALRLPEQAGDPASVANTGFIYTKDVAGVTTPFYEDDAGTVTNLLTGTISTLNQVLTAGNTTGGKDIVVTAGDHIVPSAGTLLFGSTASPVTFVYVGKGISDPAPSVFVQVLATSASLGSGANGSSWLVKGGDGDGAGLGGSFIAQGGGSNGATQAGAASLSGGAATGAGDGGLAFLGSGSSSGGGKSGTTEVATGLTSANDSGKLTIDTGICVGANVSGLIDIHTGDSAGTCGDISIAVGVAQLVAGNITVTSGFGPSGGSLSLLSGNGFAGGAGALDVRGGDAGGANVAAGANNTYDAPRGTGSAVGGSHVFTVAPAGAPGTGVNARVTALTIDSTKLATFTGDVSIAGKLTVAGLIDPTGVYLDAGGDQAAVANKFVIYSKLVAGVAQFFGRASDGTITQFTPATGGGVTLDGAYDFGGAGAGRTITVDSGAVQALSTSADDNNVFEIAKTPAGAQAGSGLTVSMGANTTGIGVVVTMAVGATGLAAQFNGGLGASSPGVGFPTSERWGDSSVIDGPDAVAVGNATEANQGSTVVGFEGFINPSNGGFNLVTGWRSDIANSHASTTDCIVLASDFGQIHGNSPCESVYLFGNIQIDNSTGSIWNNLVMVGTGLSIAGAGIASEHVNIGDNSTTGGTYAIAIGAGSTAGTTSADKNRIAIGNACSTLHDHSITMGHGSTTSATNQFVAGSSAASGLGPSPITDVYFGTGPSSATPSAYTIHGSGGLGALVVGGILNLAGGLAGGAAAAGGDLSLQVAIAGTGTTLTPILTALGVSGDVLVRTTTSIEWAGDVGISRAAAGVIVINGGTGLTPNGSLSTGGLQFGVKTITVADTPYAITATDTTILVDASGGAVTVNLPAAAARRGRFLNVKKTDASANAVTIAAAGGETIDGSATQVAAVQYTNFQIQSPDAGTVWAIL